MMNDIFRVYADTLNVALMQPLQPYRKPADNVGPATMRSAGKFRKVVWLLVRRTPVQAQPSLSGCG